jgi:1-acyl-sn-glycerol-3-phosphate acyltransferase
MKIRAAIAREYWTRSWKLRELYHRFEVRNLEPLLQPGPLLIAGYHGRPYASDLLLLQLVLRERGISARPLVHQSLGWAPGLKQIVEGMDFLVGEGDALEKAIAAGDKIIVTPGGTRECSRSSYVRYKSAWQGRMGFARIALQHRLPIVVAAAAGTDEQYFSAVDGYRVARALHLPSKMTLFFGLGPLGAWPVSPPFPVKLTLFLSNPIVPKGSATPRNIRALHTQVLEVLDGLLERAKKEDKIGLFRYKETDTWC